jgi:hypothetical protein
MAKRASLQHFAPSGADAARVEKVQMPPVAVYGQASNAEKKKHHHISVYLPPDVIKTIKLLSIEGEGRISDICARAVLEWLDGRGLLRAEMLEGHRLQGQMHKS